MRLRAPDRMATDGKLAVRPRILLVCSGLDHARRGYESFARECFQELVDEPGIELELVKASGPRAAQERVAWALRRDQRLAEGLGRLAGFRPFRLEALTFGLGLQPLLARRTPDLVYVSEWDTARTLARLRSLSRRPFRILLSNGGFAVAGFDHLDHVQELTPAARDHVLGLGADPARHTVLPYGFAIPRDLTELSPEERIALRGRLGLPERRPILLSVAALNRQHKRLDYVIEELAAIPAPRPFLLMAGEPGAETPGLRELAEARLGGDGFAMRTVPAEEVISLYRAADLFVLGSLAEMQGRALVEAAAYGIPCIAHDDAVMRFALGSAAMFGDFTRSGSLAQLLQAHQERGAQELRTQAERAHEHVYERFSWDRLRPRYVELLRAVGRANSTVSSSSGE